VRDQLLEYIRERQLMKAGERVGVAVSGGADSVALLRVLLELREQLGIVLFVAHFNHHLRGEESDADEQFVAELARQHELPFFAGRADVREHATTHKLSLEHAARELRYGWLTKLAHAEQFDAIATAHNADDQVETVLMKFLRGTGTRGLAGIHSVLVMDDIHVIRPLLAIRRAEIEAYLNSIHQPWREDHTNLDMQHTRNRLRHELLPLLERDYNPNLRETLGGIVEVALGEEAFWESVLEPELNERYRDPRVLLLAGFDQLHVSLQRRLLKEFLEREGCSAYFRHIENLRLCALGDSLSARLPGDWQAQCDGERLQLAPPGVLEPDLKAGYECSLEIPGSCAIPQVGQILRATVIHGEAAAQEPPGSLLRIVSISGPLLVRNWQPGDRFRPAHSGSEEKLKRLFSEKQIPADQRACWPVVLFGAQVVWVRGFPVAHDFAWVAGSGDALRIEALPAELAPGATQTPDSVSN
jgi:tRNA(Ile)-lysidine synthase